MIGDNCSYCDKIAIGYEFYRGIKGVNVCEDHASKIMNTLKPGEDVWTEDKMEHHTKYPQVAVK